MTNLEKLKDWSNLLEVSDFKKRSLYSFWKSQLRKIETVKDAEWLLEYVDDFADDKYYVRDEIVELLNNFIKEGK